MYMERTKQSQKLAIMRAAKERKRLEGPAPDYPCILPNLRRKIIVIDYDFGEVTHTIELYQTGRTDQYRAVADGELWHNRIGWAKVLEGIRKSFVRVKSC